MAARCEEPRTAASSHTRVRQGHPYADAQMPAFTPLRAAGLRLDPVKAEGLAREDADDALLSRQGCVHFANPGAMPVLPAQTEDEGEGEAARHLHGKAGYTLCRYGLVPSTSHGSTLPERNLSDAALLPDAAPLGCIHTPGSQRSRCPPCPRCPRSSPRPPPPRPNLGTHHPDDTSAHCLDPQPVPRDQRSTIVSRDLEGCASPVPHQASDVAPATGQPLVKLLVPALVPEP
ncbi:hypothetical protein P171DRAFT_479627 [Karstenula rhodostoma CBS 690.94]|uniref:Uncharacterized protein n=1 Tax=Karstenula rhodostoma CBS 690.94 TaxID=1392251 RepID=A0A9P4PU90_9PLEO|nr:hypothetical protein P171DRAFT_479627 [Karstenula rhodostoma CBS 690.94]